MACLSCSTVWVVGILASLIAIFKIYIKLSRVRCKSQTCLLGKTTIVTGANTGIGYETALDFAKRGARVILACRSAERGNEARSKIIEATGNDNVVLKILNLTSLQSVRDFAEDINKTEKRVDILVNNAGAGGTPENRTGDGLHLLMQINYFSHFLLTNLLINSLKKSAPSRIVNVSSMAAKHAKLDIDRINDNSGLIRQYHNTKLCNILFTKELARRLEGTGVTVYSLHPGAVKTEIFRHARGFMKVVFKIITNAFFMSSEEGAQTTIYVAVTKGLEKHNGEHFDNCTMVETYRNARDPGLAQKLWEKTEQLVKLKPEELQL